MADEVEKAQAVVDRLLRGRTSLRVLEAGSGSASHIELGKRAHVVGIDISPTQLERNPLLAERILGDIQSHRFRPGEFDVIVCWEVLEHLEQPERALRTFVEALKDDGVIVLALPNVLSLKGLVTKFTPHRFHVWTYRRILGWKWAGRDDRGPFPTYLRLSVAPEAIRRFARENGLAVEHFSIFEGNVQRMLREKYRLVGPLWTAVRAAGKLLTLGKVDPELTDFIVVLRKPAARAVT